MTGERMEHNYNPTQPCWCPSCKPTKGGETMKGYWSNRLKQQRAQNEKEIAAINTDRLEEILQDAFEAGARWHSGNETTRFIPSDLNDGYSKWRTFMGDTIGSYNG
jgi:hypothetical protein